MIRVASGEQFGIARKVAFDLAGFGCCPTPRDSPRCGRPPLTGASTGC